MAHPDYIPPGKRWNGKEFIDLTTGNLDDLTLLLEQEKGKTKHLEACLAEEKARYEDMTKKFAPPKLAAEMQALRVENADLKQKFEDQSKYVKALERDLAAATGKQKRAKAKDKDEAEAAEQKE